MSLPGELEAEVPIGSKVLVSPDVLNAVLGQRSGILAQVGGASVDAGPTEVQAQSNGEAIAKLRRESEAALKWRIDRNDLLNTKEFQGILGVSARSIKEAIAAGRMFAILGPTGEYFCPAFYADGNLHRRGLEKVTKMLGRVPAASKYHFFTSKSTCLGGATPLEALKEGRLNEVLIAAKAFEER